MVVTYYSAGTLVVERATASALPVTSPVIAPAGMHRDVPTTGGRVAAGAAVAHKTIAAAIVLGTATTPIADRRTVVAESVVTAHLETAPATGTARAPRRELDRDGAVGAEVRGTIEAMLSVRAEACA